MDAIAAIGPGRQASRRADRGRKARSAAPSSSCSATPSRTIRSWPAPFTAPASPSARSMSGSAAPASCSSAHPGGRRRRFRHAGRDHHAGSRSRSRAPASWSAATAAARLGMPFGIVDLSLAPTPAEGRQRRADPGGDRARQRRHARLDRGAGAAQRRGQEGRRHGVELCRRTSGRVHPAVGGRGHDRGGASGGSSRSTSSKR